jgi:hypothetical protein
VSSRTFSSLVGCHIRGQIGEPWDFTSTAGENLIEGVVTHTSGDEPKWLLCSVAEFEHKGRRVDTVVATYRYRRAEPLDGLLSNQAVGVNLVFKPGGPNPSSAAEVEAMLLAHPELPFLVGSLTVVSR